jgi:hypothetical protein
MDIIFFRPARRLILNKRHVYTFEQIAINKKAPVSGSNLCAWLFLITWQ